MNQFKNKLMLKRSITITLFLISLFSVTIFAQVRTVTGVVKDQTGEPIIGANILVKGTSVGTITDFNGAYRIEIPANSKTLVFSYVGMKSQELNISGNVMNVTLADDTKLLDEVVAIGYGTARRRDVTGPVSSVKSEAITAIPVASPVEAITGKLAGVQVTTTEGSPDAEVKIRVRGGGSITGDNKPLFIVDGFPVNSISDISPSDIESIDVLKDASSGAIYGSRGANGVVIVTTKSGKEGKVSVSYNAYTGYKKIARTLDVLTAYDYAKWQYELSLLKNNNSPDSYEKFFGAYEDMDLYNNIPVNDWQNLVFGRTGTTFNHNLSINGGTATSKFTFSYNHIKEKAIMQMSGFKRDNLNFKYTNKPVKNVTLDFSARYSGTNITGGGANEQKEVSSADSRLKHAMIYTPFPIKDLTADAGAADDTEVGNLYNPLVNISDNDRLQNRQNYNLAGAFTWELYKNLRLKMELGYDDYRNNDSRYYGLTTYYIKNVPSSENQNLPAVILTNDVRNSIRTTNTINYDFKSLITTKDHSLNTMIGQEYIHTQSQSLTTVVHGFPAGFNSDAAYRLTTQGKAYSIDNFFAPDDILLSFFGRANYDYKGKYLVTATFRADGSSKFSRGNRWGYFPSGAFAWRASSEEFMAGSKDWLDDLKIRLSVGTAGNNNIPSGQMAQTYRSSSTSWINGYTSFWAPSKVMANPDLKWETTVTRNLGIDFTLLRSKLSGTVDMYFNTTKDLLINFLTSGTGYDSQYRNMGETQNKGLELSLNWVAIEKKDYGLSFSANIGFNKNRINSLGLMDDFGWSSGWASTEIGWDYWIAKGGSVGEMWGYKSAGRYEVSDFQGYDATSKKWILKDGVVDSSPVIGTLRPGSMKLQDLTGDNLVGGMEDRTIIGDANPLHTGGFTLNGRVKDFDLTANFNWSFGNDVYNANKVEYTSTSKYQYRNMTTEMQDGIRWTNLKADGTISNDPEELAAMNANTTLWSPYMARYIFSDWAVEDASFLRLNTLSLGYSIPKSVLSKVKIQRLRVYATAYNIFVLTNYSGFDPEVSTRRQTTLTPGVDYSAYPKSRQLVFGLNLNF
jgi:TonB-linked SusC/RagA family outer membrane protein